MRETLISWQDNKVRWILLFYVLGTIIGAYIMFGIELLFDTPTMARAKVLFVVVFMPAATIAVSILAAQARALAKRK